MFSWIFKFLFMVFCCMGLMDIAYRYPYMLLDMGAIAILIYLYYTLLTFRVFNPRLFYLLLLAGGIWTIVSLSPIGQGLIVPVNAVPGIGFAESLDHIIHKGYIARPLVKNFAEFTILAKQYYLAFLFKNFFMVFIPALMLAETTYRKKLWHEERCAS